MNATIVVAVEQYIAARSHPARVRDLAKDVDVDQGEQFVPAVASGDLTEVPDIARELRKLYVLA